MSRRAWESQKRWNSAGSAVSSLSPPVSPGAISCREPGTPSHVTRRTPGVSNPSWPPSSAAAAARRQRWPCSMPTEGPSPITASPVTGLNMYVFWVA